MYGALILGVLGYVIYPLTGGPYYIPYNPNSDPNDSRWKHGLLGMTSLALLLLQTILPWLAWLLEKVIKERACRKGYFVIHALLGPLCYVLGVVNLLFSSRWIKDSIACYSVFVVIFWAGIHTIIFIILTTTTIISDSVVEIPPTKYRALIAYPLNSQTLNDLPGAEVRKLILLIVMVLSTTCVIVMIYILINTHGKSDLISCIHTRGVYGPN